MAYEIIYIVTTTEKKKSHLYKIGTYTGTVESLHNKYNGHVLKPCIEYLDIVPNAHDVETQTLTMLNNGSRPSHNWIKLEIEKIISVIWLVVYGKHPDPMQIDY